MKHIKKMLAAALAVLALAAVFAPAAAAIPTEPDIIPYEHITVYRREDKNYFQKMDTDATTWSTDNEKLFRIDEQTGTLKFRFAATSGMRDSVTNVTCYETVGVDPDTGAPIKNVKAIYLVTVDYVWWKWLLVNFLFGWIYL
ncbi:MAG: hypothetical protein LBG83_02570 [Oscillospiraceae bacterium]|jgi:hypothetical protein|nr:hypothetical protein [Oscillospiraceae bacterium]